MAAEPRLATTVLLLHAQTDGLAIFMVKRHRRSGFLPNAWVFPGGRVDDGDYLNGHPRVRGGEAIAEKWCIEHGDALGHLVGGIRETFEESGIWLGTGQVPDSERKPLAEGSISMSELLEKHGVGLDLDRLCPWSWWVTPEAEPRRYDTRFVVAVVPDLYGIHDDHETVDSGWFDPRELSREGNLQNFPVAPPTWWTLQELAQLSSTDEVAKMAWSKEQRPICPVLRFEEQGLHLLLPGHAKHSEPSIEGLPRRVNFDKGRWVPVFGDSD
ncbi:MAG: hypothetical protein HN348_09510 [Proteobacteria bacterium]|jgi:8-oxo-dGTP pyrophosphatase MutT (NUDIX family)|nr:hypothetical protein [Pseudomonadota bacterium]